VYEAVDLLHIDITKEITDSETANRNKKVGAAPFKFFLKFRSIPKNLILCGVIVLVVFDDIGDIAFPPIDFGEGKVTV